MIMQLAMCGIIEYRGAVPTAACVGDWMAGIWRAGCEWDVRDGGTEAVEVFAGFVRDIKNVRLG